MTHFEEIRQHLTLAYPYHVSAYIRQQQNFLSNLASLLVGEGSLMAFIKRGTGREEEVEEVMPIAIVEDLEKDLDSMHTRVLASLGLSVPSVKEITEDQIDQQITFLCHPDAEIRIEAAHILANLSKKAFQDRKQRTLIILILMAWRDEDWRARVAAIRALEKQGTSFDVTEALVTALRDPSDAVRAVAAQAIGTVGGPGLVPALISAARDPHWSVRAAAIQAMGKLRDHTFLNAVVLALDDNDTSVRIEAIYAFRAIETVRALPRLTLIARQDQDPLIRETALMLLEETGISQP